MPEANLDLSLSRAKIFRCGSSSSEGPLVRRYLFRPIIFPLFLEAGVKRAPYCCVLSLRFVEQIGSGSGSCGADDMGTLLFLAWLAFFSTLLQVGHVFFLRFFITLFFFPLLRTAPFNHVQHRSLQIAKLNFVKLVFSTLSPIPA